jgi:hypothetical protein
MKDMGGEAILRPFCLENWDSSLKTSECASTSEKSSHSEADLQRSATKNLIRSLSLKLQIASPMKGSQ